MEREIRLKKRNNMNGFLAILFTNSSYVEVITNVMGRDVVGVGFCDRRAHPLELTIYNI